MRWETLPFTPHVTVEQHLWARCMILAVALAKSLELTEDDQSERWSQEERSSVWNTSGLRAKWQIPLDQAVEVHQGREFLEFKKGLWVNIEKFRAWEESKSKNSIFFICGNFRFLGVWDLAVNENWLCRIRNGRPFYASGRSRLPNLRGHEPKRAPGEGEMAEHIVIRRWGLHEVSDSH